MKRILAAIGSAFIALAALITLSGRTQVDPWADDVFGDVPRIPER